MRCNARRIAPLECAQVLPGPHIMHDIRPRRAQPENISEAECLRRSAAAGVDDEDVRAFGRCTCVELRRVGGSRSARGGERLRRRADRRVLVECKELGVLDDRKLVRTQFAQLQTC